MEPAAAGVGVTRLPVPTDALTVSQIPIVPSSQFVSQKRVMVASRGNPKLLRFAFEYAKAQQAEVWVVFIRYIAVAVGPARPTDVAADNEAQQLNQQAEQIAAEFGVPWRFVYATSNDIADTVLDIAATHAVDVLVLGATRRGTLWKVMKGDVIQRVAELLPESINLLIHA
jgi:K+-sensing histidine kinase KdpD